MDSNAFTYSYSAPRNTEALDLRNKYEPYIKKIMKEVTAMNKNDQEFLVQKIRTQYTEKEHTQLDELRALDNKVKKPANVFACVFGSVSAIVMGAGMSLVMTDIGAAIGLAEAMVPGIIVGVAGLLMAIVNYPIYKKMLASRRKKYAQEIIRLSDSLMQK